MDEDNKRFVQPFGELDCESDMAILGENYRKYYFFHTRFNNLALDTDVFLIAGRRGTGKTALSQFFSFQNQIRQAIVIDVDEPDAFQEVLQKVTFSASHTREIAIPRLARIWDLVIWSIIFRKLQDEDIRIKAACIFGDHPGKISHFIRHLLRVLLIKYLESDESLTDELEGLISDKRIIAGQEAVFALAKKRPIIIAFDTLEKYAIDNDAMMHATAALVQCAATFNRTYAHKNIHFKLFLMSEIFSYLKEEIILNPLKVVRNEIYLHWTPKDLMRLISWRLYHYLQHINYRKIQDIDVDWEHYDNVRQNIWDRFFGEDIINGRGLPEKTFPYVLSHTQLRPRQLIMLCNSIAKQSMESGDFPNFTSRDIIAGISTEQRRLAEEVYNSYSSVYPEVSHIVDALSGLPMVFTGNELDKVARRTAAAWRTTFSPLIFRKLVVELGIVGRVRHHKTHIGLIEADFEYATEGRLILNEKDTCVIHPLFHERLHIQVDPSIRIYPFPDHKDFRELGFT